jgi:hypothetical protein
VDSFTFAAQHGLGVITHPYPLCSASGESSRLILKLKKRRYWLGKWAMNQMLINVATRKFARSVRLPGETFRRLRALV